LSDVCALDVDLIVSFSDVVMKVKYKEHSMELCKYNLHHLKQLLNRIVPCSSEVE